MASLSGNSNLSADGVNFSPRLLQLEFVRRPSEYGQLFASSGSLSLSLPFSPVAIKTANH